MKPDHYTGLVKIKRTTKGKVVAWLKALGVVLFFLLVVFAVGWIAMLFVPEGGSKWPIK